MLLRQAGIEPLLQSPGVDEDAAVIAEERTIGRILTPPEHVQLLAQQKAVAVVANLAETHPGFSGIVIGGDSMFELDGEVYGKPHLPEIARERWQKMRGNTGVLHSGHCVYRVENGVEMGVANGVAQSSVTFVDDITDAELEAYIASGEPLEVAGSFTVDSLGGAFIEHVAGDPSTVVGMSLSLTRKLARDLGVGWTDLWNR